uniref:Succinate dehydrogenase subunit 4 n=1 Tax=Choreocolax polysiphoniae TaxID=282351 RepID=A0A1J0F7C5_9FLOR|nr:succinate dehydrogenase subunit 4 [Choreocolax polysiphoniae]APC24884.1 succinate dehydrogenase subunit 4 [Choreocolax polysiphoniae]
MFYLFILNFYILFFFFSFILDIEFILFFINFIFLHIFYGLTSIFKDYIHINEIIIILIFLNRLLILNIISLLLEIIF